MVPIRCDLLIYCIDPLISLPQKQKQSNLTKEKPSPFAWFLDDGKFECDTSKALNDSEDLYGRYESPAEKVSQKLPTVPFNSPSAGKRDIYYPAFVSVCITQRRILRMQRL